MKSRLMGVVYAFVLVAACGTAKAAVLSSVTFTTPTGTVGPNDTIPLWMTLSLAQGSDPLTFDSSSPTGNLPTSLLPTTGVLNSDYTTSATFASYQDAYLTEGEGCGGSLNASSCSSTSPYTEVIPPGGTSNWFNTSTLDMTAGQSRSFNVVDFAPQTGPAAPGTYTLTYADLEIAVDGLDANGAKMSAFVSLGGASNFSRTVTAVPVPDSIWLFSTGLAGLVGLARRLKGHRA